VASLDRHGPIHVLIAVAVRLFREGLAATLGEYRTLSIVGTAASAEELTAAADALRPDVVIVDVSLPDVREIMSALRDREPAPRILAFAVHDHISAILECAEAGADGYATANASIDDVVAAIESTVAGELRCSPRVAAELFRRARHYPTPDDDSTTGPLLTSREQQVFDHLQQGHSNKEIGSALNIAEATVKNHVHNLLEKLRVTTRAEAAASARSGVKAGRQPRSASRAR
jgi:two-component system nitrate/nitrite response regulator NarL